MAVTTTICEGGHSSVYRSGAREDASAGAQCALEAGIVDVVMQTSAHAVDTRWCHADAVIEELSAKIDRRDRAGPKEHEVRLDGLHFDPGQPRQAVGESACAYVIVAKTIDVVIER